MESKESVPKNCYFGDTLFKSHTFSVIFVIFKKITTQSICIHSRWTLVIGLIRLWSLLFQGQFKKFDEYSNSALVPSWIPDSAIEPLSSCANVNCSVDLFDITLLKLAMLNRCSCINIVVKSILYIVVSHKYLVICMDFLLIFPFLFDIQEGFQEIDLWKNTKKKQKNILMTVTN